MRRRLPDTRRSITHHFNVAGHEGYLTVGQYEDGSPGELFITMSKEGSTIGGLMDSLGTAISVALQYGVPIESLVTKFAHQRFEPMGMTTNRDIPFAKSLVDYIFRWMGMEFIAGYREANAPPRTQGAMKDSDRALAGPGSSGVGTKEDARWSERVSGLNPSREAVAKGNGDGLGLNGLSRAELSAVSRMRGGMADPGKIDANSLRVRSSSTSGGSEPMAGGNGSASIVAPTIIQTHFERSTQLVVEATATVLTNPLDQSTAALMGDAPACDGCGSITVRNGSCYKCMNCGNSMGCS
jgi:ribonucleoside-diphosphate reductase alpha chain